MKNETGFGLFLLGGGVAAGILGYRILRWTRKAVLYVSIIGGSDRMAATTVIGGSDGPTAVFLAGKLPSAHQMGIAAGGLALLFILVIWFCVRRHKKEREE